MQNWYWTFLEQSANFVEAMVLVVLLHKFFERKYKSRWPVAISVFIIFLSINVLNILNAPMVVNLLVYFLLGFGLAMLFFKGSTISRLLVPLLMISLLVIAEVLTMGVLNIVFAGKDVEFMKETAYRMLGIVISKVALIMLVYWVGRFSRKEHFRIPWFYSVCILLVPLVSAVCMVTVMLYVLYSANTLSPVWPSLTAAGLLFINFLIVYLFEAIMNYSRNLSQFQLMSQQTQMLSNHLRETNALQEETHRIWHDMKNHFTVIQWMVKSKSYDKLDQYMQNLNETVTNSMLQVQSGNPILDALLNPKATEAKKYGIDMTVNACIPAKVSIDDLDLNILFSNALDNAFEACMKLPEGSQKFIDIDASIKKDHLVLVIKNSFNGDIRKSNKELKTTKHDAARHGIGLGNMRRAVEKYDGHIMVNIEENTFILSAIMHCAVP